ADADSAPTGVADGCFRGRPDGVRQTGRIDCRTLCRQLTEIEFGVGGVGLGSSQGQGLGTRGKTEERAVIGGLQQPVSDKHYTHMLREEDSIDRSGSEVTSLLQQARTSLEELRLDDAERQFLRTFSLAQEKSPDSDISCLVHIYTGLAEVCTRRSRGYRQTPLEWLWLCVHAGALLNEAAKLCGSGLETELDNQTRDWLSAQQAFALGRSQNLADVVGRTLLNWLREDWRLINPYHSLSLVTSRTPMTPSHYPLTAGQGIAALKPYHTGFLTHGFSLESLHDPPARTLGSHFGHADWFRRIQLYCHRRLHGNDVKAILKEVLAFDGSTDSDKSHSEQKGDSETISEESESVSTEPVDYRDVGELSKTDTPVKEYSLSYELAASKVDPTGWDFFLEKRKDYVVQSVIQLVTSHDGATEEDELEADVPDEGLVEDMEEEQEKEIYSPLQEKLIKLMMAKIHHKLVGHLMEAEAYTQAELLCENILEIVDEIQDGSEDMLRFSAQVMQNTGLLCLRQGLVNKGRANLDKALRLFRDLQDHDAHREVAMVLIDLGNAYVTDDLSEDTLYAEVIAAICEFFEKEAADEQDVARPDRAPVKELLSPKDRSSMGNIDAAISCYTEALKNYTEALVFYEKALGLFRLAGVYGKEAILENAHVLIMLGVSTFMLHVYPRAAHVFELALHMVKHAHGLTFHTFLHGLLISLMGITFYKMKSYHNASPSVARLLRRSWALYGEKIVDLPQQKFWLVCQNLYMLGNTYNILNLQHKAIKFLNYGRLLMQESTAGERRQHMRILQILGDCYFAQYDYKTALIYYNEALDIGDKLSSSQSESEMSRSGSAGVRAMVSSCEDLDMALHNQLLSRSADAHISMKQYQSAVHYLEQARDIQDVLEEDIKGDLVTTLQQLGQMHIMAGDIDKAIESYRESLDVFREMHNGQLSPEMCETLGNLATMCYVKACVCEEIDQELEMILAAEQYFQESLKLEIKQCVCVKYANYLYSQANYEDAVLYLQDALRVTTELVPSIVYGGLEKVTLPEALQDQVEAQEQVLLPATVLAYYLLLLSHKQLGEMRHAEESLMNLMHEVYAYDDDDSPFLQALLGLAMMELGVFREAALHFRNAWALDPEYHLALDNYCLCLCLDVFNTLQRALGSIFVYCRIWCDDEAFDSQVAKIMQAAENMF
ncbi:hypothetical protein BaRGS_00030333, partial [Batillaria attramentaria]